MSENKKTPEGAEVGDRMLAVARTLEGQGEIVAVPTAEEIATAAKGPPRAADEPINQQTIPDPEDSPTEAVPTDVIAKFKEDYDASRIKYIFEPDQKDVYTEMLTEAKAVFSNNPEEFKTYLNEIKEELVQDPEFTEEEKVFDTLLSVFDEGLSSNSSSSSSSSSSGSSLGNSGKGEGEGLGNSGKGEGSSNTGGGKIIRKKRSRRNQNKRKQSRRNQNKRKRSRRNQNKRKQSRRNQNKRKQSRKNQNKRKQSRKRRN